MKNYYPFSLKFTRHLFFVGVFSVMSLFASATTFTVESENYFFTPNNIANAIVGDTVLFVNIVSLPHQPASTSVPLGANDFDQTLQEGESFMYVLTVPGTYNYHCALHGSMVGTITVGVAAKISTVETNDNNLKLYPQPFKTNLTIDLNRNSAFKNNVTIEVTNGIGQRKYYTVSSEILSSPLSLDLSTLSPGIYFVSISEGATKKTYRLIKSE